jgi:hypothetical protein
MKIRAGFVSNSSSSSFIIGVPSGETIDEEALANALAPKGCAFTMLAKSVARHMVCCSDKMTAETYLADYDCKSAEEVHDELVKKMIKNNMTLYQGWASNDGDEDERVLSSIIIMLDTEKMIVSKPDTY